MGPVGPPRKISKILILFDFSGLWKNGLRWPQIGPGIFFLTNPDLADILGRTDLNFEIFLVFRTSTRRSFDFSLRASLRGI